MVGAPAGLIAPSLELVVRPNDWEKRALAASSAATGARTPTKELYLEFWSTFEPLAKERRWTNATAPSQNWWSMPTGLSGAAWTVSFAQFGCRSELYFGDPDPAVNLARWKALAGRRADIEAAFGDGELIFDELPNYKGCRVETRLTGPKIADQAGWPKVIEWMLDTQERLRRAVSAAGGVPNVTPPSAVTEPADTAPGSYIPAAAQGQTEAP
jgi:hypothetical protein